MQAADYISRADRVLRPRPQCAVDPIKLHGGRCFRAQELMEDSRDGVLQVLQTHCLRQLSDPEIVVATPVLLVLGLELHLCQFVLEFLLSFF